MSQRLTDPRVKSFPIPASGNRIYYDLKVKGFGCRVTAAGGRAFILNYRTRAGRERRFTIGSIPEWKTGAARQEAEELKKRIDRGQDPLAEIQAGREAPTVADLCTRYLDEHAHKKRSESDDIRVVDKFILPDMRNLKVADVTFSDIDGLHRKITKKNGTPTRANRVVSLMSKMFSLAIRWGWRSDNPAKGIERNPEPKRDRYLSGDELARLTMALGEQDDQQAANVIRMLLLTGARRGEVLSADWNQFDLANGVWTKPGATTKQKTVHRVPLSAPARQLLAEIHATKGPVFPDCTADHLKRVWEAIRKRAEITGVRIHDLRHTYASLLASSGLSLPVIGALLGHTQTQTTQRYAHLLDDPLRQATETVGAIITGKPVAEVHVIRKGRA